MRDTPIPPPLFDLQSWFANIITSSIHEIDNAHIPIYPSDLIEEIRGKIAPSPTLKSEERLGIYQQQYWWRLLDVMQEIFPSLVRLFHYKDFNQLIAEPYLLSHPPEDWFLSRIGSRLPEWLENNYQQKDKSLILELARLDLAYENLMFFDILPKIDPEKLEETLIYLQPFVLLFEFKTDLFSFRDELMAQPADYWLDRDFPEILKFPERKFFVLYRQKEMNFREEISEARFTLLSQFQKGAKLEDLIPILSECGDVHELFQTLSSRNWLTFETPIN